MGIQLAAWRTSLSAALGFASLACGGHSKLDGSTGDDDGQNGGSGGTTSVTGGSSGTAGAAGTGPIDLSCHNPQPVWAYDGSDTGFVSCDGGFIHRPEPRDCPSKVPRAGVILEPTGSALDSCSTDDDCTAAAHGYCAATTRLMAGTANTCVYGCVRDEDCAFGAVCLCGDPVGACISALCSSDADCDGLLCTATPLFDYCYGAMSGLFACQTPNDTCRTNDDCSSVTNTPTGHAICGALPEGRRCSDAGACGRPYLVDGEARLPAVVTRDTGWASGQNPCVDELDRTTRDELAEHYGRLGAMEHASVAAFARFTLELLSLGAPAELVADSQRALGDEIRHAELCFGLASAYAGRALGPGPLSSEGALGQASFEAIVENAFAEACIGETLAAVEAAEAAEHATDVAARRVLSGIAEDERRHAELGWRFVSWAIARSSAAERARLERRFAEALWRARAQAPAVSPAPRSVRALLAHGLLTDELRREARRAAFDELVMPLVRALVARAA